MHFLPFKLFPNSFFDSRSRYILPITQLLITLRFYACGSMQITVADFAGVCFASVCRIVRRVTDAIVRLRPQFIKMPETEEEKIAASSAFHAIASFPRVIGAIDCTHIKIQSPGGEEAENFRNRKGWFSLNVQTISGADLKVNNIVARWPGGSHDQTIFNNSVVRMRFDRGDFGNYILVGDSGYRNSMYMATPFLNIESAAHNLYNESQIRTRNVVERSYGVLKRRFAVLSTGIKMQLQATQKIIVACAVLHNIAIDAREDVPPVELIDFDENIPVPPVQVERGRGERCVRDILVANHFAQLAAIN